MVFILIPLVPPRRAVGLSSNAATPSSSEFEPETYLCHIYGNM
jgi:hypothetical protein